MKMKRYYIYQITNLINGKTYVGQHGYHSTVEDSYMGSSPSLREDIKTYGKDNFQKSILIMNVDEDHIDCLEKSFIIHELEKGNTYNKLVQGSGKKKNNEAAREYMKNRTMSESAKKKLSQRSIGNKYALGHVLSDEWKRQQSERKKGKPTWNKGLSGYLKDTHWYNNGIKNVRATECPGPEWSTGRV